MGTQFHPEKSGAGRTRILENFLQPTTPAVIAAHARKPPAGQAHHRLP